MGRNRSAALNGSTRKVEEEYGYFYKSQPSGRQGGRLVFRWEDPDFAAGKLRIGARKIRYQRSECQSSSADHSPANRCGGVLAEL